MIRQAAPMIVWSPWKWSCVHPRVSSVNMPDREFGSARLEPASGSVFSITGRGTMRMETTCDFDVPEKSQDALRHQIAGAPACLPGHC